MMSHWSDSLERHGACAEAVTWARGFDSFDAAWAACERGDWMLWWAGRVSGPPDSPSRRRLVAAAQECAREAWPYITDGDTALMISLCDHVVSEYLAGRAELDDVRSAAYAAYAAAYAASAAAADAAAAAYAAAAAAADAAHRREVLRACADIVRRHYPTPPEPSR